MVEVTELRHFGHAVSDKLLNGNELDASLNLPRQPAVDLDVNLKVTDAVAIGCGSAKKVGTMVGSVKSDAPCWLMTSSSVMSRNSPAECG